MRMIYAKKYLLAFLAAAGLSLTTAAQAPVNDTCTGALELSCGQTLTGDNTNAEDDVLPAADCGDFGGEGYYKAVWYTVTPTASGTLTVATCGSDFDTYLRAYTGDDCDNFTECMGYSDDGNSCDDTGSELSFAVEENVTYYILLGGYGEDDFGAYTITATCLEPAANDSCADAIELSCGQTLTGNTGGSSDDVLPAASCGDDPDYGIYRGVWYKITPAASGTLVLSTCGASFDSYLRAYKGGDCDNLTECMGSNDDGNSCDDTGSELSFSVEADSTYYILLAGLGEDDFGAYTITATCVEPAANDSCADAMEIACGQTLTGATFGASDDVLPAAACTDDDTDSGTYKGVWYKITTPDAGNLTLSTCGSGFDTYLRAYKGNDCDNLTECMGFNGYGNCDEAGSELSFAVEENTTYYILLGGYYDDAFGNYTITATCFEPTANDSCTEALELTCGETVIGNTTDATDDALPAAACTDDNETSGLTNGVWYTITPAAAGNLTLSSCGSGFDTYLRAYKGEDCDNLTECMGYSDDGNGCNDSGSELSFPVEEGTTYYVLLGGYGADDFGTFTLTATCYEATANDSCADALELACGQTLSGNTIDATDDEVPAAACEDDDTADGYFRGVWYKITPAASGSLTLTTCDSGFDTYLRAYKGNDCDNLTECMGYNDDGDNCDNTGSELTFEVEGDTTYYILLGGYGTDDFGGYSITATCTTNIDSVEVSTQGGVPATITTDGGTLQMEAAVFPASESQDVTWSIVPGTGSATINATGLVTAETNGTVWAKAVSVVDGSKMDSMEIVITNQVNVGLDEVAAAAGFKVYPNPAQTSTHIFMTQQHAPLTITIVDVYGRAVSSQYYAENALNTAQELTLEGLPQGVYFIRATGAELNFSVTFIKQ